MPRLSRETAGAGPLVQGFAGSGFLAEGIAYPRGLMLTPQWVHGWDAPDLDALEPDHLTDLLALVPRPEFILLGTGVALRRPPPLLLRAIEALDIGVEAMDSRAAARAWGVLRAEDRWIAAALLPLA